MRWAATGPGMSTGRSTVNDARYFGRHNQYRRYQAAIDAVRDSNGAIVCRSTLTNPNNGCVPYNIFGTGVIERTLATMCLAQPWGRHELTEDVVAGTLRGEPMSTWAGAVSMATGFEHREKSVTGSNDPPCRRPTRTSPPTTSPVSAPTPSLRVSSKPWCRCSRAVLGREPEFQRWRAGGRLQHVRLCDDLEGRPRLIRQSMTSPSASRARATFARPIFGEGFPPCRQ